jgi:hypothetical protein
MSLLPDIIDEDPDTEDDYESDDAEEEIVVQPPPPRVTFTDYKNEEPEDNVSNSVNFEVPPPREEELDDNQPKYDEPVVRNVESIYEPNQDDATSFYFTLTNALDQTKRTEIQIPTYVPLGAAFYVAVKYLEGDENIPEDEIKYTVDGTSIGVKLDSSIFPADFVLNREDSRRFFYRISNEKSDDESPETPPFVKPREQSPNTIRKSKPKVLTKSEDKSERVSVIGRIIEVSEGDVNSEKYQEARAWLQEKGATNNRIYKHIRGYLSHVINKGKDVLFWTQVLHDIEDWIQDYDSYKRHKNRKKQEVVDKGDTMLKVKYDPIKKTTTVEETKYAKALRAYAKANIAEFENAYPEYFDEKNLEDATLRLKELSLEDLDEEEDMKTHNKYKTLKKQIKKGEEKDLQVKTYVIYSFFVISGTPLQLSEVHNFWKDAFNSSESVFRNKKLINAFLKDKGIFHHDKDGSIRLRHPVLVSLSKDEDFVELLNMMKLQLSKDEDIVEDAEYEIEEIYANARNVESEKYLKMIKNLSFENIKNIAKMAEKLPQGKLQVSAIGPDGEKVTAEDDSKASEWEYMVEVKRSISEPGKEGLFALETFYPNEKVVQYTGAILTEKQYKEKYQGKKKLQSEEDVVPIDIDTKSGGSVSVYIDPEFYVANLGRYVRTSKNPNSAISYDERSVVFNKRGKLRNVDVWVEAIREISPGEEITLLAEEEEEEIPKNIPKNPEFLPPPMESEKEPTLQLSKERVIDFNQLVETNQPVSEKIELTESVIEEPKMDMEIEFDPDLEMLKNQFDYSPDVQLSKFQISERLENANYQNTKDEIIEAAVKKDEKKKSRLLTNLLKNIRTAKIWKLKHSQKLESFLRALVLYYSLQGKDTITHLSAEHGAMLRKIVTDVLQVTADKNLSQITVKTSAEAAKYMTRLYVAVCQHGLNQKYMILSGKKTSTYTPEEKAEYDAFRAYTPIPSRMSIIITYCSVVLNHNFDEEYRQNVMANINTLNGYISNAVPDASDSGWGFQ